MSNSSTTAAGRITIGGDLDVSRLGYGAMRLTGPGVWGPPRDSGEAHRVLHRAIERGVTFIDTADAYGPDTNEDIIAEALHPYPAGLVIATKGGLTRSGPNQWNRNGRPEHLRQACEGSLKRLRLERIDLYQLHSPDPAVPLADSIGTLADLQREGKIRHVGVSNVDVEELAQARRHVAVVSVQNRYNLTDRASDDVLAVCEKDGLAFLPWYPLAAGDHAKAGSADALDVVARRHGGSPVQVSIAWLLARSPAILPIPGTGSAAHLDENLSAASLRLSPEDLEALG